MLNFLEIISNITTAIIGTVMLILAVWAIIAYFNDKRHPQSALRRSFPLLARGRYNLEHAGVFLRQYLFAMDREELPFNREQRRWAYRAADNENRTIPFGSTHDLNKEGEVVFKPSLYPTLTEDSVLPEKRIIGEDTPNPYIASHIFNISGMSFGSLSKSAVIALGKGAKMSGCWLNTGEGGITPYHLDSGADIVMQIGTAYYSVRTPEGGLDWNKLKEIAAHPNIKMFELKLSQGAKPGKGGILPAKKITEEISKLRGIPINEDSVSPNRHIGIETPQQLLDFIGKIKTETKKPCGIKLCLGNVQEFEELVSLMKNGPAPDFITIDGGEGGTGASPASLIDFVGLPLFESLPIVHQTLINNGLREQIEIIASGKLITPDKVATALAYGADFCVSARGFIFALGCIQALHCNDNTCPTGITTQNKRLEKGLKIDYRAIRVKQYAENLEYEVGAIAHSCGCPHSRALKPEHLRIKH